MAQQRTSPGYWQSWENVERELQELIRKLRRFPTYDDFRRFQKPALAHAIWAYHGGITAAHRRIARQEVTLLQRICEFRQKYGRWPRLR